MRKRPDSTDGATRTLISPDGRSASFPTDLRPTDDYVGPAKAEEVEFKCGHKGPMFYAMSVNGDTSTVTAIFIKERVMCAACLTAKLTATPRCAICGHRIEEDSQVALYLDDGCFRSDATRVEFDTKSCVIGGGCCVPEGIKPAGRWRDGRFVSNEALAMELERQLIARLMGSGLGELMEDCAHCDKPDCPDRREAYVGSADGQPNGSCDDAESANG
jgi:hypothetical protein